MIHVTDEQRKIVEDILRQIIPNRRVVVFGSRVTGNVKPFSDLDLAVAGSLSLDLLARLREAFSESDLPFRVDVVDLEAVSGEFRKVIEAQAEEIQLASAERGLTNF